jgi:lysophospholipase L1-like esterase
MRRRLLLALLLAVGAGAVAIVLARPEPEPDARSGGAVTLVGDSLNVGIEPYLPRYLAGWTIDAHDEVGRTTSAGLDVLRAKRDSLAPVVVISLGTNDDADDVVGFRRQVRAALRIAGQQRCVVWVTMARDGATFAGFNDLLADEARRSDRLRVVDWARMVEAAPELLAGDGIHATETGYTRRAAAVARAVRDCPGA